MKRLISPCYIIPINDTLVELDETVDMTLGAGVNYNIGVNFTASLTILDNDIVTVDVIAGVNPAEPNGTGTLIFNLDQPGTAPITVNYSVGGSATPGTDYTALSGTVNFAIGQTTATVNVTTLDDFLVDPNETVDVTLGAGVDYNIGVNSSTSLTIGDNETANIIITETNGLTQVTEGNSTPDTYTIALNSVPISPVEITLTADTQTQISTDNNSLTSTLTLNFTDSTPQTINVFAVNDTTVEGLKTSQISQRMMLYLEIKTMISY